MGVLGGLGDGVDRRRRDVVVGEVGDGILHGHVGEEIAHGLLHHGPVGAPLVTGGEPGILQPLGLAQGVADPVPVVLVTGGDEDPAVLAGIGTAGRSRRLAAPGLDARAVVGGDGDLGVAVAGVGQADVNGLALAGCLPLVEGGQGADGGVEGGGPVDDGNTGADGGHPLLAGDHGDAGHGLADGVVSDLIGVGAKLAVGGNVDHDDAGVNFLEDVVAEAHGGDGAGTEVLEEHVGDLDQLAQDLLALFLTQVDAQALLPAVVLDPVGALLAHPGGVVAGLLAAETLDLDDLGTHAGQHLGATGSSLVTAKVKYPDSIQWAIRFSHRKISPRCCSPPGPLAVKSLLARWGSRRPRPPGRFGKFYDSGQ